jgi:hypothetical protein
MTCPLSQALLGHFPDATIRRRRSFDWHSAGHSGQRVELSLQFSGLPPERIAMHIAHINQLNLSVPPVYLADIVVVERWETGNETLLKIEALLLDEDI